MKEQAEQFRKILHHMNMPKKATDQGLLIPYENLAYSCIEFTPGECYSFFGSQDTNTKEGVYMRVRGRGFLSPRFCTNGVFAS